jgi:hypothetical protein
MSKNALPITVITGAWLSVSFLAERICLRRLQALVRRPPCGPVSLGRRERANRDIVSRDPGVRTPVFECSGSHGTPLRTG